MKRPVFSIALAIGMLGFASWSIASKYSPRQAMQPPIAAPTHPYDRDVAGTGIVEPASEVIALAVERGGVVRRVNVIAGAHVKTGDPLFSVDQRNYAAAVAQNEAATGAAEAQIASIDQSIVLQQDAISQAAANLESAESERVRAALDHKRYSVLAGRGYATRQRFEGARADAEKAVAGVAAAKAALASAKQQREVLAAQRREAQAKLAQAKAALEGAQADLDKTVVRAPVDGVILKVNVRPGEYAQAGVLASPLMTMGRDDPLHVRADIDETEAWRVRPESPAMARLRGNPAISVPLSFVRFEPYVLPKKSLSGDMSERVDTRVLQVIYAFAPKDFPAFVGQQVDVFIKATGREDAAPGPVADAAP
jgi:multidrug resistance efflux pump